MTKDDEQTMDALGITYESKSVLHYKGLRYERLADAVRFAQNDIERRRQWEDSLHDVSSNAANP